MLTAIKLLHTAIWALVAGCILALPITGLKRRFDWAAILTVIIVIECGVLAFNGGRCPLTDLAAGFPTTERITPTSIYPSGSLGTTSSSLGRSSSSMNFLCCGVG